MKIAREEIFGPVMSIMKWSDKQEMLKRANASAFGLASGVFTTNINTANYFIRGLRTGTVWVNTYSKQSHHPMFALNLQFADRDCCTFRVFFPDQFDAAAPFGGYKMTGIGDRKSVVSGKS